MSFTRRRESRGTGDLSYDCMELAEFPLRSRRRPGVIYRTGGKIFTEVLYPGWAVSLYLFIFFLFP